MSVEYHSSLHPRVKLVSISSSRRRQPSGSSLSSLGLPSLSPSPVPPDSPFASPKVVRHRNSGDHHSQASQGSDTDHLLPTPPGSPSTAHWRSRLNSIKNNFLGSPRFHRRKMQGNLISFKIDDHQELSEITDQLSESAICVAGRR